MAVFTYTADYSAQVAYKPRVRKAQFGDGYSQRTGDGINTATDTWNLTFAVRTDSEALAILTFLSARGGYEAFDWTPPTEGTAIRVVCSEWNRTFDHTDKNTITATFTRVFEP